MYTMCSVQASSYHWYIFLMPTCEALNHWQKSRSDRSVFKLPRGLVEKQASQHYFVYGPVSEAIPGTSFRVGSSIQNCSNEIRELFLEIGDDHDLSYEGLYKCLSKSHIAPKGIKIPGNIVCASSIGVCLFSKLPPIQSSRRVAEAASRRAHSAGSQVGLPSVEELQTLYRDGVLKVECVIFQCVGFNHNLYETLTQYNSGKKRKNESIIVEASVKKARGTPAEPKKNRSGRWGWLGGRVILLILI